MAKRSPKRINAKVVRLKIEQGKAGLFYGTSIDLPSLLVAATTREAVIETAPQIIADLYLASGAESVHITHVGETVWSTQPKYAN